MKKFILAAVTVLGIISSSYGYGLYQVNSFSSQTFSAPTLTLAS
ncbi:hypothetical protein [Candidatus Francisella endociliophora]|nr:hypothetical protein [Francisella sp. FSC1006]